jgi:HSP20 family molecular chaperone IbpA
MLFDDQFLFPMLRASSAPAIDVLSTPTHYVILVDLPGVSEKSIKVDASEDGNITIAAERPADEDRATKSRDDTHASSSEMIIHERWSGHAQRSVYFPRESVNIRDIHAELKPDGVLFVSIAKQDKGDSKRSVKILKSKL